MSANQEIGEPGAPVFVNNKTKQMKTNMTMIRAITCVTTLMLLHMFPMTSKGQTMFVINSSSTVGEYYVATGAPVYDSFITGLASPDSLAVTGSTLYVSSGAFGSGTVNAYNLSTGGLLSGFTTITGLDNPWGMAASGSDVYVANQGTGTVTAYNANTGVLDSGFTSVSVNHPFSLALSGSDLFVGSQGANTITEYNASTGAVVNGFSISVSAPGALAISGSTLFVTAYTGYYVAAFNLVTQASISSFGESGAIDPGGSDLAVSGSDVYASTSGGVIAEYSATTGSAVSGYNGPPAYSAGGNGLAIAPVPEPSTWVMMAPGVAVMIGFRRRRRS